MNNNGFKRRINWSVPLNCLIVLLVVALIAVIIAGKGHEQKQYEEVNRQIAISNAEKQQQELARQQLAAQSSFYQKLADGFDVNVLIIGDNIGALKWPRILASRLQEIYDVQVNLTNISMKGSLAYAGYVRTNLLDDGVEYDLAVINYGYQDSEDKFPLQYEAIIRAVQQKYEKCSIICVLEYILRDYLPNAQAIQAIAAHYGLPVADNIAAFREDYNRLTYEDESLRDVGNQRYAEIIVEQIAPRVAAREGYTAAPTAPYNAAVTGFDQLRWYKYGDFTRSGDTFTLNVQEDGKLGIDYTAIPGDVKIVIQADGAELVRKEFEFDYGSKVRYISFVADDCRVEREIVVSFGDHEQADAFGGLYFSSAAGEN